MQRFQVDDPRCSASRNIASRNDYLSGAAYCKKLTSLSLPYLLNETKYLLSQITKQPGFSVLNPVFIILEDCKNAWIASRMIEACFSRFNNDPKVWIIQGNFREFLDLSQFIAEGIDFAMCFEGDLQNEFSEYPLSIF